MHAKAITSYSDIIVIMQYVISIGIVKTLTLILVMNVTVSVRFTERNISLQEGIKEEICLITSNHNRYIHPSTFINFTLQSQGSIDGICYINLYQLYEH